MKENPAAIPMLLLGLYLAAGCGVAAWARAGGRSIAGWDGFTGAALMGALWPFLLPATLIETPRSLPVFPVDSQHVEGIQAAERRALLAIDRALGAGLDAPQLREILRATTGRLIATAAREAELGAVLASTPASTHPQLLQLRQHAEAEINNGVALIDDLVGKLTLYYFSEHGTGVGHELNAIQDLIHRIQALAELHRGQPGSAP